VGDCPHTDTTLHVADETLFAHCPQCGIGVEIPLLTTAPERVEAILASVMGAHVVEVWRTAQAETQKYEAL
jgi:hypothetical protein